MARNIHNGSFTDDRMSKISMADEDHTLANAIRFPSYKDPRVTCCGYSIPHPSDNQLKIRVQTTGDPVKRCMPGLDVHVSTREKVVRQSVG